MTKRQLFLIAGLAGVTVLTAACPAGLAPCEENEVTGETFCPTKVTGEPTNGPATTVDEPQTDFN